jgi:hypothetical protein
MDGCRLSKEVPQALGYLTFLTNLDIQLSKFREQFVGRGA